LKIPSFAKSKSAFILCLSIVSTCCCCAGVLAQSSDELKIKVLHHTDDSDKCVALMQTGISTIPPAIQRQISGAGISVVLTPTMVYDEPERSGETVFRNGGTTQNIGGLYQSSKSRVLIPERSSVGNGVPRPMGNYTIKVMRHELGHAWDFALGRPSQQAQFIEAYDKDFAKLSNEQCRALAYCITGVSTSDANVPTASGHQECFAEAFAALTTPRAQWKKSEIRQSEGFSNVAAYLQTLNSELGKVNEKEAAIRPTASASASAARTGPADYAAEDSSPTSNSRYEQAVVQFKQKQYAQALAFLNEAIRTNPNNGKAFLLRGTTNMWLRDYRTAAQDYTDYIRIHPQVADGYALRARAYGYMGLKAKQDIDTATANSLR
jgi:tetratricopeptide (TPR) repeat protein